MSDITEVRARRVLSITANALGAAGGDDPITITVAEGAATGANYDTATNTLAITLGAPTRHHDGCRDLATAIKAATVDGAAAGTQVFTASARDATSLDINAGVAALRRCRRPDAHARRGHGCLFRRHQHSDLTLNSDLTNVTSTDILTAVNGLTAFTGSTASGPTNIATANVTADATYGTLERVGVLADYGVHDSRHAHARFRRQQTAIDIGDVITAIDDLTEFDGTTSTSSSGTINGTATIAANDTATLTRISGAAASFNTSTNTLTLTFDGSNTAVTAAQVISAIDGLTEFDGTTSTGTGTIDASQLTETSSLATGGRVQDLVVRIAGELGSEVFTFEAGTSFSQIAAAIESVSDATGVTALVSGSQLSLTSTNYGTKAFVAVEVISEGSGGTFESNLSAVRDTGSDIAATINGVQAEGEGNKLSVNTATLDLSLTVADGSTTDVNFTIDGGGALFQLGPSVVSNQQARMAIESIATGTLGGINGRMYELRSGNARALATDPTVAARIVDEAITSVVELRGRLGSFQRTSLETNIAALQDTMVNLTSAESSIRDADFAKESAALTRAQILVQSGTAVLTIANQNPQNVLALLR